jgi:hypothetical protein
MEAAVAGAPKIPKVSKVLAVSDAKGRDKIKVVM